MPSPEKTRRPEGLTFEETIAWAEARGIAFEVVTEYFGDCGWCGQGRYANPYNLRVIEDPRDVYSNGERLFTGAAFGECDCCGAT